MSSRLSPPHPDKVREARLAVGYTQNEAAAVVHSTGRRWREWEAGDHRMPPAAWELFLLRTQAVIFTEPAELADMPPVKE